jgi:hypothetical protein
MRGIRGPSRPCWTVRWVLGILVSSGSSGCLLDGFDRLVTLGGGEINPLFDEPVVWIATPEDDSSRPLADLLGVPGIEVRYDGAFSPGLELHLVVFPDGRPDWNFFVVRQTATSTEPPPTLFVTSTPALLGGEVNRIWFRLRVLDPAEQLLSLDSVMVRIF